MNQKKSERTVLFVFHALIIIVLYSCSLSPEENKSQRISKVKPIDTLKIKSEFFSKGLDKYYGINGFTDNTIPFDYILSTISTSDLPVPEFSYKTMLDLFGDHYKFTVNNDISNFSFQLPWNTFKSFTGFNQFNSNTNSDTGFALFYIVNNSQPQNKYFTYVISMAVIDPSVNDSIRPINPIIIGGIEYYLMLTPSDPYHVLIPKSDFVKYYKEYKNTIKTYLNNTVYDIDTLGHPQICYHSGRSLYYFFNDNKANKDTNNLFVVIKNIANGKRTIYVTPNAQTFGTTHNLYLQAPICIFKYNNQLQIDNNPYRDEYDFKQRALDVGRLCPPDC